MSEEKEKNPQQELQERSQEEAETSHEELDPDELMAQQFGSDEESGVDADILMAQQFAQEEYQSANEQEKFSLLLDIPLEVTVEIGSTEMRIEEVLKLNPNSIIELDRYINEPVDLKVNGRIVAKGELYTVKNNFAIRITHIVTPEDRLKIIQG